MVKMTSKGIDARDWDYFTHTIPNLEHNPTHETLLGSFSDVFWNTSTSPVDAGKAHQLESPDVISIFLFLAALAGVLDR